MRIRGCGAANLAPDKFFYKLQLQTRMARETIIKS